LNIFSLFKRKLIYKFKKKILIDNENLNLNLNSLDDLLHYYGSDKADIFLKNKTTGHGFSKYYQNKLIDFKYKKINILEIGSYSGASAAAFAKFFPNSNVFCFDINISNFIYKSKQIHVFGLDIKNKISAEKALNLILTKFNIKEFDVIIDDGSHNLNDILITLKSFFKLLKKKGLFIIEDFKYPNYYKYNKNIEHIYVDEFLKNLEDKKISPSKIFTENEQIKLMNSIIKIKVYKGNLKDSDIAFITKN